MKKDEPPAPPPDEVEVRPGAYIEPGNVRHMLEWVEGKLLQEADRLSVMGDAPLDFTEFDKFERHQKRLRAGLSRFREERRRAKSRNLEERAYAKAR